MVISHEYKYVFIEVPQTASTAITAELRQHYGGERTLHKHANYSQCCRAWPEVRGNYFTFAAVRNPLDQVVSYYTKLKTNHRGNYTDPTRFQRNGGWVPELQLEHYEFIQKNDADFASFFREFYSRVFHEWVLLGHGQFDFVMRFENIREDFATVLRTLGLCPVRPLPVVNPTEEKKHFLNYYPPEIRALVARYMGPFLKKWGYGLPSEWGDVPIPWSTGVRFSTVEALANSAARHFTLNPRGGHLQLVRRALRRLRS